MRTAILGALALSLGGSTYAADTFEGVMTITYGYYTDAEGRHISLVGKKVPFVGESIPLGGAINRPGNAQGTDLATVYQNDHGKGSYIVSGLAMPSALDDVLMSGGANAIWQSFTFGMNVNNSSTSGSVFMRWTGYGTFTPGLGAGVMAFSNPVIDFGGSLPLIILNPPPPGTYKVMLDVSGFNLSANQNQLYFAQQFRDGNQNGPFRMEFDNVFSRGFPSPGSSQETFYFDFEPNNIFDEAEVDQWPVGEEANMLLTIVANPSGTVETRLPSSFVYAPGAAVTGGIAQLWDSDNEYVVARPGIVFSTQQPPLRMEVTSTSTTTAITAIAMVVESKSTSTSIQQQVEFFNYNTNGWVLADTRNSTLGDTTIEVVAPGTASHYVHPTSRQVKTRLSYRAIGPIFSYPWRVSWDQAVWRITRP